MVATAGLSLGEYTALVFAGALTLRRRAALVQARGRAMQAAAEATPCGMVSVLGLELPTGDERRGSEGRAAGIWIANYLCPGNTVAVRRGWPPSTRLEQADARPKGGNPTCGWPSPGRSTPS